MIGRRSDAGGTLVETTGGGTGGTLVETTGGKTQNAVKTKTECLESRYRKVLKRESELMAKCSDLEAMHFEALSFINENCVNLVQDNAMILESEVSIRAREFLATRKPLAKKD